MSVAINEKYREQVYIGNAKKIISNKKKNGLSEHLSLTYCYIIWQNKGTKETAHERKEK